MNPLAMTPLESDAFDLVVIMFATTITPLLHATLSMVTPFYTSHASERARESEKKKEEEEENFKVNKPAASSVLFG